MFVLRLVTVAHMDTQHGTRSFHLRYLDPLFCFPRKPLCKHADPIKHCCLRMAVCWRRQAIWSSYIICWVDKNLRDKNHLDCSQSETSLMHNWAQCIHLFRWLPYICLRGDGWCASYYMEGDNETKESQERFATLHQTLDQCSVRMCVWRRIGRAIVDVPQIKLIA